MEHAELKQILQLTDGTQIYYRLSRPGRHRRLLVLVHGAASNMTRWSEFVETTSLKEDFDILRLDLRGHGDSLWRGRLRLSTWSRDICEILDHERYQDAIIVGHSLGAQVAMDMATRYPSRVAGLVLIDPVFYPALYHRFKWFYRSRFLTQPFITLLLLLNKIGLHRRHIRRRDLRLLDISTRKELLASGKGKEMAKLYGSPWPDLKHFPTVNYVQELYLSIRPVKHADELNIPVLNVLATVPTYTVTEKTERIIEKLGNGSIGHVDAYHWPLTEKPEETRQLIERWCRKTFSQQ
ncbi:MAG: alpha/beta hydrolase [Proteobacteria bacterium]|nr:alpha/beta hydrolase [Pseudomonadota bacterium]